MYMISIEWCTEHGFDVNKQGCKNTAFMFPVIEISFQFQALSLLSVAEKFISLI